MRRDRGAVLTRTLLRCGMIAGPAFLGIAAVEGHRRNGYRSLRHPISSLALGERGRVQAVNFFVTGALCGAFATGLTRLPRRPGARLDSALVALSTVGLLGCGLFPADPVNGYPPGTPPTPEQMTRAGYAHLLASSTIMVGVPVTTALQALRALRSDERAWAGISGGATALTAASFAGACAGFAQVARLPSVAGLLQRVAVGSAFAWLGALAVRALREIER